MQIERKFFPEILPDNEEYYFEHLKGIIESVDELSCMIITKMAQSYHFRIASSHPKYNDMLLKEILKYHNLLSIRLDLSKSIKTSGTISFEIHL